MTHRTYKTINSLTLVPAFVCAVAGAIGFILYIA